MALNVLGPALGLIAALNPGGEWDADLNRTGGTWPGTIAAGNAYQPTVPYEGETPVVFVSSVPTDASVVIEGAATWRLEGTLELVYLDRTMPEQGRSLAHIDADMATNLALIVGAILAKPHLEGAVVSVVPNIQIIRDPEGLFRSWQSTEWVFSAIRVPFHSSGFLYPVFPVTDAVPPDPD